MVCRYIFLFSAIFLTLLGCSNCFLCPPTQEQPIPATTKETTSTSVDSKNSPTELQAPQIPQTPLESLRSQIKMTPLSEIWHYRLEKENIVNMYICGNLLLVETNTFNLLAFDRTNGTPIWVFYMGAALDFKPVMYKDRRNNENDYIYLLNQAHLQVIHKNTGSLICKKDLGFVPSSPIAVSDKYLYVGAWDNFIYAINREIIKDKNGKVVNEIGDREWRYRIDGYAHGQPILVERSNDIVLLFSGTDQRIYAISAENGYTINNWGDNGRYETRGANIAGLASQENPSVIYQASRDYNLYCLHSNDGIFNWKFESGGEIKDTPLIVGTSIYTLSYDADSSTTFYCLSSDGKEKWNIENGILLLFLGKQYDWIVKKDKNIAAIKNGTGKIENTFDFSKFDCFVSNTQDNKGYFATKDGYIFAVEER